MLIKLDHRHAGRIWKKNKLENVRNCEVYRQVDVFKVFFQEIPVAHSSKFPIEGLNDANQQYNAKKNSFTNNLMKFSKEKHKGSQSIFE